MTEDLRPPRFTDQVIMIKNAPMGFEFRPGFERDDEMLVPQTDQFGNVPIAGSG